eukprot:symbB.v1.2.015385.t1/scaffold1137.1/size135798/4
MLLTGAFHERACPWQLAQDGAAQLSVLKLKRHLSCSRSFLRKLLAEKELTTPEVRSAHLDGGIHGLEVLMDGDSLLPGSVALTLRSDASEAPPFAVVCNVSEGALGLQNLRREETATLLEDLSGQPTVQEILAAASGGQDGKDTDAKDDEADLEDKVEDEDE